MLGLQIVWACTAHYFLLYDLQSASSCAACTACFASLLKQSVAYTIGTYLTGCVQSLIMQWLIICDVDQAAFFRPCITITSLLEWPAAENVHTKRFWCLLYHKKCLWTQSPSTVWILYCPTLTGISGFNSFT